MSWWKWVVITLLSLVLILTSVFYYMFEFRDVDIYVPVYVTQCSSCHGTDMRGGDGAGPLIDEPLQHGDTVAHLIQSIRTRHDQDFSLSDDWIKGMAIYIAERRLGQRFIDFKFDVDISIPQDTIQSEQHAFTLETVASGLDPNPFSIEPLPDGSFLLTEKERGLTIVSPDGTQSDLIKGTPTLGWSIEQRGIKYGVGWLLDVALHPDYENNGWIYLHYTDLCDEQICEGNLVFDASMNRLDRGRIVDGEWTDVETLWKTEYSYYSALPDTGAGGRIAFDDNGHVFISVGFKPKNPMEDTEPQDLNVPSGKIHRINDDGTIPADNPFLVAANQPDDAPFHRKTIWTYGHRSPQGLEWNPWRQTMWESEMGPRGGDEINELLPGRNYGWPFHSLGLEYSGVTVARHRYNDIEFDVSQVEQTLVDITPSPATSSFVFYDARAFPHWQGNLLLTSLKGMSLFRMVFDGATLVHKETLVSELARIRDIEVGYDGLVYLLLESRDGSQIVRIKPA